MLTLEGVSVRRGRTRVLHGIDLHVAAGEIVALVGANGAGKTSLLMTVSGLLRPESGTIRYAGDATADGAPLLLNHRRAEDIVALGIAHCPEGRQIFGSLTVRENLAIGAYLRRDRAAVAADLDHVRTLFPVLAERGGQAAGSLSGGEQMMLAIARALMARPRLLLLDEPSLGLAPQITDRIFDILVDINRQGTTLLLVEQNAAMALDIADRAYVLETGAIALSGSGTDVAADDRVRRSYLGGG